LFTGGWSDLQRSGPVINFLRNQRTAASVPPKKYFKYIFRLATAMTRGIRAPFSNGRRAAQDHARCGPLVPACFAEVFASAR
jgi:hypothetical protein